MWYEGDEPISMIGFYNFSMIPEYALLNLKVFKKSNYFDINKNGYMHISELVNRKEKENRYSFLFLRSVGHTRLNSGRITREMVNTVTNMEHNFGIDFAKKYIRTIEEHIPAGETSKIDAYSKILFRGKVFEEDTVVCRFTCLQKYRSNLPEHIQKDIVSFDEFQTSYINRST
jgi:hypothetical protein